MGALRRFFRQMAETDEERLAEELRDWCSTVEGTTRIADAPNRRRVKVVGMVRRITVRPVEGFEALEAVIYDGTGELTAVWLGRRSIPGLLLGSRLVLEGVIGRDKRGLRVVNPTFEFA